MLERLQKQTDFTVFSIPFDGRPQRALGTVPHVVPNGYYGITGGWTPDANLFAFWTEGSPTSHIMNVDVTPILQSLGIH